MMHKESEFFSVVEEAATRTEWNVYAQGIHTVCMYV